MNRLARAIMTARHELRNNSAAPAMAIPLKANPTVSTTSRGSSAH
jgi:hypothetical protein